MRKLPENLLGIPLSTRARMALKDAAERVVEEHIQLNLPIYIWRDGKVAEVSPRELAESHAPSAHR